ncbi:DUF4145 domain-containing protein (plasmid) [Streptomyces phaeoluteigriseus]|uniref:DUF4145 domain-containing protein n=1 Tax=Streptomyces phaeoluteigriseus TaxID=114686 RepID=A0ABY4ZLB6_9ACTN|nr:DUF4145 domain-containing protein [Streptomyces phaeoluteigriseus]USQ89908.1 DUF4145 domain-containing protein [Streptomyces phaeoluteigriseus]
MASTICGWCGDRTHMAMVLDPYQLPQATWPRTTYGTADTKREVYMAAFRCANENCQRLSVGWRELGSPPAGTVKARMAQAVLQWEPLQIRRPNFPDVPSEIAATASEAHGCLSIGAARGAVALARAVVESAAKAKGITVNGIVGKIDALRDAGTISALTADASHQIRKDGNSIAHGDIGDEPVSTDDAEAILEFMDAFLDEVFQRPAKLQRLKERHEERKQGNSSTGQ